MFEHIMFQYSFNIALFSLYSLLSNLTQTHLGVSCLFALLNSILGTPIQSLSIPPLLSRQTNYMFIYFKDIFF